MRCLVVEDDDVLAMALTDCVEAMGHVPLRARTVSEGFDLLRTEKVQLLLLDYRLPDGNSLPLSEYASATCPDVCTIMLTGSAVFPRGETGQLAPGIDWILRKPVPLQDLAALVDHAARAQVISAGQSYPDTMAKLW